MKIELTPDSATWVKAELDAGHFATAEDAVRFAIEQAKLAALRATIEASLARGGSLTADDVMNSVRHRLATQAASSKA